MNLSTKIIELNRVGKTLARRFKYLGIATAQDLLFYFPFRYEDYRQTVPIKDLRDGATVTVRVKIELLANKRSFRKHKTITEALVSDESGSLRVVWFNQPYIGKMLKPGDTVNLSGKVKFDMLGAQLVAPMYEKVQIGASLNASAPTYTGRLVPIYPLTDGVTQRQMRFLVGQVIGLADEIKEWIPEEILEKNDLVPLAHALRGIHFPVDENDLAQSTDRLKFGELFLLQIKAARARMARQSQKAPMMPFLQAQIGDFVNGLPFDLTRAQRVAAWEILQDLERPKPMNRLLSGDVGSGKTVVAVMAMYSSALNGFQAALMAPTEILARQHYDSVVKLLGDKIRAGLFSRSQFFCNIKGAVEDNKKEITKLIKSGEIKIIIGTHALLSEKMEFKNLGLVIVDEQHRFGVGQRKEIKGKVGKGKIIPHFLSMTATPIPRSLALLLYGDLDLSVLSEMPPGRKPIITKLVEPAKRDKAYGFIREQVKQGRQVFVVCPLIQTNQNVILSASEESLSSTEREGSFTTLGMTGGMRDEKRSVMSEYEKLSKKIFPDLRVAYLHGKMKDKDKIMADFKDKKFDILISTSVVEVGVDVPNASVMMIEGAERFGLAQLHQFRGRVGRFSHQSYCLLFTDSDADKAQERLKFFEGHHDGFKLAEKDLEMRGPGEVYGLEQSGMMNLRLAKLTDRDLIKKARDSASDIIGRIDEFESLKKRVDKFVKEVHLE